MSALPLEILVAIGLDSLQVWRALLIIPAFAHWTLSSHARQMRRSFLTIKNTIDMTAYYLGNNFHNFDDEPAVIYKENRAKVIFRMPIW